MVYYLLWIFFILQTPGQSTIEGASWFLAVVLMFLGFLMVRLVSIAGAMLVSISRLPVVSIRRSAVVLWLVVPIRWPLVVVARTVVAWSVVLGRCRMVVLRFRFILRRFRWISWRICWSWSCRRNFRSWVCWFWGFWSFRWW